MLSFRFLKLQLLPSFLSVITGQGCTSNVSSFNHPLSTRFRVVEGERNGEALSFSLSVAAVQSRNVKLSHVVTSYYSPSVDNSYAGHSLPLIWWGTNSEFSSQFCC